MSDQTRQLVDAIRHRLRAVLRRITLADLTFGLLLALALGCALWVLSVAVEAGFWLGTTPRTILFWLLMVGLVGLVAYAVVPPVLRLTGVIEGLNEKSVAQRIGVRFPEVSDRLVNLLDLAAGRHSDAPQPLLDGAVRRLGEEVAPVPFEQVEDFARARRMARWAALPVLALLVFLVAAPSTFMEASGRLLSPGTAFQRPAPFQLSVAPGSVELVKGAPLEIAVTATGQAPLQLILSLNNLDEETTEDLVLTPDSTGTFRHTLVNVRRSLRYQITAPPVVTPWYTAAVVERPIVRGLQVGLTFPRYTRIPPQRLEPNVGDVTALPGTTVDLGVGVGGVGVTEAFVRFNDGRQDTLRLDGSSAEGAFLLRREGHYQIVLQNDRGLENSDPITYQLRLLADAPPAIALVAPAPSAELNDAMTPTLRMRFTDDFGFARLRLFYRLAESRFGTPDESFHPIDLPLDDPRLLDQALAYAWVLRETTDLDPVPGDVIEYYVQVWDNDSVAGYKTAVSATQRLRLPSLTEQYEALDQNEDEAEDAMERIQDEAKRVREQFEELRDELRRKPEADWEDQRQLEQLRQRQESLEQSVEALSDQMESITQQMEENNLVSEETMEMFEELQNVVQEVNSPEMMEALKQLEQSMQDLNLQQMQQSLENFQFNEQQYQQRLERALDLFKQMRVQQDLEEAARRAEELAKQEERLAEETGKLMDEEEGEEGENQDGEQGEEGENQDGQEGEQGEEGENQDGQEGEEGENQDGQEGQEGEEGENQDGQEGEEGEQGENQDGEQGEEGDSPRNEELAKEQERTAEEMAQLEKLLQEAQERMKEVRNTPQEQMQQMQQQMDQQKMQEQMQENAEQLRNNELQPAQEGQQQMQQQLQQMQQQLQQMQQQMQGQQQQMNMAGLRQALNDVLVLSQQQEALREEVRGLAADSPILREKAQAQIELSEGLSVVSDSLQSLARNIPQMSRTVQQHAGEGLREMGAATDALAERIARRASGHQKGAMTNLNELALLLSDLLNQMMNAQGSGQGSQSMQQMMQQLQNMAGQQQQLNQQIQQMLNDMQGNRLSSSMQERLRQMAGQQERLRQDLRQLSRNKELRNQALGDLNRIAEQMQETIEEMQGGQVNKRRMVQRQQQILTRLLDASRSMQERGRENRREGRRGDDILQTSPDELTPSEQADKLRRDLLRALESGYAPDYETLIRRYFELLQQSQNR